MAEAILLVLWLGTLFFFGFREEKRRKDKENHELWIIEASAYLHSVECEFRRLCQEKTESYFSKYSDKIYHLPHINDTVRSYKIGAMFDNEIKYKEEISELKKEYLNEVYIKVAERMKQHGINALPERVVKEYERNITDIAHTFTDFVSLTGEQIRKIRDDYIPYTDIYGE